MTIRFVRTFSEVRENALKLHEFASGTTEEQKFHRIRVRNALHHVVIETESGNLFAPAKWCGAYQNDLTTYHANKDPITDHFRRVLRKTGIKQISPGHKIHQELYDQFVDYCAEYGFIHSKPDSEQRHFHLYLIEEDNIFPDDLDSEDQKFMEGALKSIFVNRYERDPKARQKCIEIKGTSCLVCDFDFGSIYGEMGDGFIHVHHNVPLSTIGKNYTVDPETDLEPVCPNCHAMLHRTKPPLTITKLKKIIAQGTGR